MMKNILVLAYAVSPTHGSEFSVAWNYIVHMSKNNHLVVLYGVSDEHLGEMSEMQEYLKRNTIRNVKFVGVETNKKIEIFNFLNRKGIFNYTFYLAFNEWQKLAFKKAKKIIKEEHIDLIHCLGPIGYREPGYLWKLDKPYIWGPISGFNNVPINMLDVLPIMDKIKLGFRYLVNSFQMYFNRRVRKAIKRTDVLLAATSENGAIIKKIFEKDTPIITENAIHTKIEFVNIDKFSSNTINLIWIGRIDGGKSLIIALKALTKIHKRDIILNVVGDGPLKEKMQEFSKKMGIDDLIKWHGKVPRSKVYELLTKSHLHLITSVSEGNPTTIWEAMSVGVPTLSLDHCGMHDVLCDRCGIKIPIASLDKIVADLTFEIDRIQDDKNSLYELALGTIDCAQKYRWSERIKFWEDMYDLAIENHAGKNKHS